MGAASVIAQFNGSVTFKTVATLLLRALRQNDIGGELAGTSNLRQHLPKRNLGSFKAKVSRRAPRLRSPMKK